MKIIMYAVRDYEKTAIDLAEQKFNIILTKCPDLLSIDNVYLAEGHDSVIFTGNCDAGSEILEKLSSYNIKYITTRTAGYDNIDLKVLKRLNMKSAHVPLYSPNAISEFTVLSILSILRKYNIMISRVQKQNYSLNNNIGREIRNMNIGVIGAGRIGLKVIETLDGFTPKKILANDIVINKNVEKHATYSSLETLLKESDIITLHTNLTDSTYHIINKESIKLMKDGVVIINTCRGAVVDTKALLDGIDSGKIAGYATDVYEYEKNILHYNLEGKIIDDELFNRLKNNDKVIISPHSAFYTDEAVENMVEYSIKNIYDYIEIGSSDNNISTD